MTVNHNRNSLGMFLYDPSCPTCELYGARMPGHPLHPNTPESATLTLKRAEKPTRVFDPAGSIADFKKVDGGGYKASMDDQSKLPVWLVPGALVRACARALAHGAKKYAPHNWRRGMKFSEVLSALERHVLALKDGEAIDPASGLHHLDHIAANTAFLSEFLERPEYAEFNDLFRRGA